MIDDYKTDLLPENEARLPCAWCGAPHVTQRYGFYRCARHDRTRGKPPMPPLTIDQSPVEAPTIRECVEAVRHGLLTRDAAEELALRPRRKR